MSLPDPTPPRKPRRLGLYGPFAALFVLVLAWSLGWFWLRGEVFRRMDAGAEALSESGYRVDWTRREVSGFPFRLDLDIEAPRVREGSGWGLSAPRLKAEAFVFAPEHWIVVAPAGVTLVRRRGGPLLIGARVLRASASDWTSHPARVSVEGLDLTFTPQAGAAAFPLAGASELHLHAKGGPNDQGAAYVEIDGGRATPGSPLGQMTGGAPVALIADGIYSHASALNGRDWPGALRAWAAAGGRLNLRRLSLTASALGLEARTGDAGIDPDGRLAGVVDLDLKGAPRLTQLLTERAGLSPEAAKAAQMVIDAGGTGGKTGVSLHFEAGRITLGPVALGPAPRLY